MFKEWDPLDQAGVETLVVPLRLSDHGLFVSSGDSDLIFAEDEEPADDEALAAVQPWVVLVVDDDPSVHEVTSLSLRTARIGGRPVELLHAYSASEALEMIRGRDKLHMLLLDVVMETQTAGLNLVRNLRDEARRRDLKIVLRTGQPGRFSEQRVRENYEIDGYIQKSLQTRGMLIGIMEQVLLGNDPDKLS
ncbi:response regulator [Uliginosibacterium sp. H1]|uniref:response regulator n=1 Tax=Uliginosibacterium sp. H1 TaxID=3114757 RepID=UPI002E192BF2|nr:response regulator [Uliginosibacterium sp. H1]